MQESIVDQAADAIREYVISRGMTAGQRLPSERDLADALGTSRPALREAIRRLSAERVLEVRGRSGIYIASPDVEELFAVRLRLEPLAAELTAARRTSAELKELQAMLTRLRAALPDAGAFSAIDRELHGAIARFSGNTLLAGFILQLGDLALISRGTTARGDETRRGTAADMARLVSAIRLRDGHEAGDAMSEHLRRIRDAAGESEAVPHLPRRLAAR